MYGRAPGRWSGLGPQLQNLKKNESGLPLSVVDSVRNGDRDRYRPLWRAAGAARRHLPRYFMRRSGQGADKRRLLGDRKRGPGLARRRTVEARRLSDILPDRRQDDRALSRDRPQDARQGGRRGDRRRRSGSSARRPNWRPGSAAGSARGVASCRNDPAPTTRSKPSSSNGAPLIPRIRQVLEARSGPGAPRRHPHRPAGLGRAAAATADRGDVRGRDAQAETAERTGDRLSGGAAGPQPEICDGSRPTSNSSTTPAANGSPAAAGSGCLSRTSSRASPGICSPRRSIVSSSAASRWCSIVTTRSRSRRRSARCRTRTSAPSCSSCRPGRQGCRSAARCMLGRIICRRRSGRPSPWPRPIPTSRRSKRRSTIILDEARQDPGEIDDPALVEREDDEDFVANLPDEIAPLARNGHAAADRRQQGVLPVPRRGRALVRDLRRPLALLRLRRARRTGSTGSSGPKA